MTQILPEMTAVRLSAVAPGPWQSRQRIDPDRLADLALSILQHGQIEPAIVWPAEGRYQLVAGERRWRALCALALADARPGGAAANITDAANIAAVTGGAELAGPHFSQVAGSERRLLVRLVSTEGEDPGVLHELALVDNLDREDLTPLEEAQAIRAVQSARDLSIRQLADRLNRSRSWIDDRLNLLKLAPEASRVLQGRSPFPFSLARHVGRIIPDWQGRFAEYLVQVEPSEREAGALVAHLLNLAQVPGVGRLRVESEYGILTGNARSVDMLDLRLGQLWLAETRSLDPRTPERRRPDFPLDWNPRADPAVTISPDEAKALADPASCDFCGYSHGNDANRRCLRPACFQLKSELYASSFPSRPLDPDTAPTPPAPTPVILSASARPEPGRGKESPPPAPAPVILSASARPEPGRGKESPSPPSESPPPRPLPVMQPLPATPAGRAVVLTATIKPGPVLIDRIVLLSIGYPDRPAQFHRATYAGLVTLIAGVCDQFFSDEQVGIIASAELVSDSDEEEE